MTLQCSRLDRCSTSLQRTICQRMRHSRPSHGIKSGQFIAAALCYVACQQGLQIAVIVLAVFPGHSRETDHDLYSLRSVRRALGIRIAARDVLSSVRLKEDTDYWTDRILFGKSSDGRKHGDTWVMWKGVMKIAFRLRPGHPMCSQMAWQTSKLEDIGAQKRTDGRATSSDRGAGLCSAHSHNRHLLFPRENINFTCWTPTIRKNLTWYGLRKPSRFPRKRRRRATKTAMRRSGQAHLCAADSPGRS